jgi:hypothetical protein
MDLPTDELEITLRPPVLVAARAIVVAAVCRRAHLELSTDVDDPEGERFDLAAWLVEEGLDPVMVPGEQRLIKARIGRVEREELVAASWQVEGLATLIWSLSLSDDATWPASPASLMGLIPSPWEATRAFRAGATLRSEDEIARERERAELWYWRAETDAELAGATGEETREAAALVREVAEEAYAAGFLPAPIGHDFPVGRQAFRSLPSEEREEWRLIAVERLRALNWVCGFGTDWESVPLDV